MIHMVLKDLRAKGFILEANTCLSVMPIIQKRVMDAIHFLVSIHMICRYLLLKEHVLVWMGYDEIGKYVQSILQRSDKVGNGWFFSIRQMRER